MGTESRRVPSAVDNVIAFPGAPSERRLTTAELAAHLAMSERWIRYRLEEGMPHRRYGRTLRFLASEVDAWLNERYRHAA
jgi:excisionase family DNA binding protein